MDPFGHSLVTAVSEVRLGVYVAKVYWIESVEAHATRAIEKRDSEKQGVYYTLGKSAMPTSHTRAILYAALPTLSKKKK